MEKDATNRLAITDIDFDEVTIPTIFKILESEAYGKIIKITLYAGSNSQLYAVCEFKSKKDAMHVYSVLDGIQIERSGHSLNLSFIPDDFVLDDQLVSECTSSENFQIIKDSPQRIELDENMIEIDDDCKLDIEIPDEFKSKTKSDDSIQVKEEKPKRDENQKESNHDVLNALKKNDDENDADIDFEMNLNDERFQDLYNNEDFALDASNKKFKTQKASKMIIEKKFNEHQDDK